MDVTVFSLRSRCIERKFPGWFAMLRDWYAFGVLVGFLTYIAESTQGFVLDPFRIFVFVPLTLVVVVSAIAWMVHRWYAIKITAAWQGVSTLRVWLLCLPLFYGLFSYLGFTTRGSIGLSYGQALASFVSVGVLGSFSLAARVAWAVALVWLLLGVFVDVAARSWLTFARTVWKELVVVSAVLLLPSMATWIALAQSYASTVLTPVRLQQGWLLLVADGFVWKDMSVRFPLTVGGEEYVSTLWLLAALALISVIAHVVKQAFMQDQSLWERRTLLPWKKALLAPCVMLVSAGISGLVHTVPVWRPTMIVAFVLVLVTLGVWTFSAAASYEIERFALLRGQDVPLFADGAVRPATVEDLSHAALAAALLAAWLLGFSVFVPFAIATAVWHTSFSWMSPRAKNPFVVALFALAGWNIAALPVGSYTFGVLPFVLLVALVYFYEYVTRPKTAPLVP